MAKIELTSDELELIKLEKKINKLKKIVELKNSEEEIQEGKVYVYYRISSKKQEMGSGLDRQDTNIETFCKNNNINIDYYMEDKRSAFSGANLEAYSELGAWVSKINAGIIKNPTLIFDKVSRFSRNEILIIIPIIFTLMNKGVVFRTVDGIIYSKETPRNHIHLQLSLDLAHSESVEKSDRLKGFWKSELKKRHEDKTYIMRITPPSWIRLKKDNNGNRTHEFIKHKVETIKLIIKLSCEGLNLTHIKDELNKDLEKYPVWGTGKRWYRLRVRDILKTKAIYGTYENYVHGIKFDNYYPKIVSKTIWQKANNTNKVRKSRKTYKDPNKPYTLNLHVSLDKERAQFNCVTNKNVKGIITGYNSYYRVAHKKGLSVPALKLEDEVYTALIAYTSPKKGIDLFKRTDPEEIRLSLKIQLLQVDVDNIKMLGSEESLSLFLLKKENSLLLEIEKLEKELNKLQTQHIEEGVKIGLIKSFLGKLRRTDITNREKLKRLYSNIIRKIIVEKGILTKIILVDNNIIQVNHKLK